MTNDKQRERLVELLEEADQKVQEYILENDHMDWIPKLKELAEVRADHLLANGVIVPPCKVGDVVWYINQDKKIDYAQVACIDCRNTGNHIIIHKYIYGAEEIIKICVRFEEFGKTVFLTKEEAEKALGGVQE